MKPLSFDCREGRLGDLTMRLVALHAIAGELGVSMRVSVPSPLKSVGLALFGDRLELSAEPARDAVVFSCRGIRQLGKEILLGPAVATPYRRIIERNGYPQSPLSEAVSTVLDVARLVNLPPRSRLSNFNGYVEAMCIPELREVTAERFEQRVTSELPLYRKRIAAWHIGAGAVGSPIGVAVFPSGTDTQFMPPEWASERLPKAVFAFHRDDSRRDAYAVRGLRCEVFENVEGIAGIAARAGWVLATESFPLHIVQLFTDDATLCLTLERGKMISLPGFGGRVVESTAPCAPCAGPNPIRGVCRAGRTTCLSWEDEAYSRAVLDIPCDRRNQGSPARPAEASP